MHHGRFLQAPDRPAPHRMEYHPGNTLPTKWGKTMMYRGLFTPQSIKKQHFSLAFPQRDKTYCSLEEVRGLGAPGARVKVYIDRYPALSAKADCRGGWTLRNPYPLADGRHRVKAVQRCRGRIYCIGTRFAVCRTLQPDAPSILEPPAGAILANCPFAVSGQADPGNAVTVRLSGHGCFEAAADACGVYRTEIDAPLSAGAYTVAAVQTNACGNVSPETQICFCIEDAPALLPPRIEAPQDGETVCERQPVISGQAASGNAVIVCLSGFGCLETAADASGVYRAQFDALLPDDLYVVTATQRDAAGNTSEEAQSRFVVSVPQPLPPPTIDAPQHGETVRDRRPVISGQAAPGNAVIVCLSGFGCLETAAGADGRYQLQFEEPLSAETYALTAVQLDAHGNASPQAQSAFTVAPPPGEPPSGEAADEAFEEPRPADGFVSPEAQPSESPSASQAQDTSRPS